MYSVAARPFEQFSLFVLVADDMWGVCSQSKYARKSKKVESGLEIIPTYLL
jgi:hypothetical protein